MWEINDDVDILATHHWMEDVHVDSFHIVKMKSRELDIEVDGSIDYLLQWGSDGDIKRGDGHQFNDSFPFKANYKIELAKNTLKSIPELIEYRIDTSGWYE